MSAFFTVDSDNILHPLEVLVTRDSRREILPAVRESVEEIPGKDGEIDFGTELKARILELHCVTDEGMTATEKMQFERDIAMYLNPANGVRSLVFSDDPNKTWMVKCAGNIMPDMEATWFKFVISFKMSDPYILGTEKTHTGSGALTNEGSKEVGVVIEMKGPLVDPQISVGPNVLFYDGEIPAGYSLIVDTGNQTARIEDINALDRYNSVFPLLYPGDTPVSAGSNTTFTWREKWI